MYFCFVASLLNELSVIYSKLKLNTMKTGIFLLSIVFCSFHAFSQEGNVTVYKDNRIDMLVKMKGEVVPPNLVPQMEGYRVQIFFDNSKASVDEARNKFLSANPKIDTYIIYTAPNYFLKAGDFRTQLEAERVKTTIDQQFPGAFIVKEQINLPRIDQ